MDAEREKYARQARMLANRVKKRHLHLRKRFSRQNIDVFRLYDWDIPEIRAVVDWYAGHLVVGEYVRKQSTPEWLSMMGSAAAEALGVPPDHLHLKERLYGRSEGQRYSRIATTNRMIVVSESDLQFYVNPWDWVDTGLFGDHRLTRRMVREACAGKEVLNLFCYTGSFSCYAAKGGARSTVSVDRSKTAIAWTRRNMALNGIGGPEHRMIQAHAFDFLSTSKNKPQRFDLAVVDPPSFYTRRSEQDHFDIATDHPILLNGVAELMRPDALIFFSTNHQDFTPRLDELNFTEVIEITADTIPEDYQRKRSPIHRCWRIRV
ncbi:MAG: SAM-dependent methyltransferase [Desulfobacteraceae bacterium]|nr:MAG: SAM-dependent methyltransferase [Desulfobacteraceae bacterium]